MRINRWIATSLMLASLAGSTQVLNRRRLRDKQNRTVLLAVDYDDCCEISTRSGIALGDLLHDLWHQGASHLTIKEQTLGDLLDDGSLFVAHSPTGAMDGLTHLTAYDHSLLTRVGAALAVRVPGLAPLTTAMIDDRWYLGISGTLRHLRQVTVGFDPAAFALAHTASLVPVARPRHYPWPQPAAIEAVLAQAATLNSPFIAFADNYVLGHEMFMQATIQALHTHQLVPVYFAESRHQKGDWFIAKASLPNVVLGHEFSPDDLDLEDEHGMAHKWGRMADRGIRFFSIRTMRGVHATDPLSLRDYVSMVLEELTARGLHLAGRPDFVPPAHHHSHEHHHHAAPDQAHQHAPAHRHAHTHEHAHGHEPEHSHLHDHDHPHGAEHDDPQADHRHAPGGDGRAEPGRDVRNLQWVALAAAGAGGLATAEVLGLPEPWASLLTLAAGGAAWVAVPLVDRPHSQLEESFPPSYAPKAIGLGLAVATPMAGLAAAGLLRDEPRPPAAALGLLLTAAINSIGAAGLAATVASEPYMLRVEAFRGYNLDWAVPLGAVAGNLIGGRGQPGSGHLAAVAGAGAAALGTWLLTRSGRIPSDVLGLWANRPLQGHTHHLSAFQARLGDWQMAASPQPLARWGWLLPAGSLLAAATSGRGHQAGLIAATLGSLALLAPFRQGAPAVDHTIEAAVRGLTAGLVRVPVEALLPAIPSAAAAGSAP